MIICLCNHHSVVLLRCGILATEFSEILRSIDAHTDSTLFLSSFRLIADSVSSSFPFCIDQRFSIGFKFGELPGHSAFSQEEFRLSLHHCCVFREVWAGALSCILIALDMLFNIWSLRMDLVYRFCFSADMQVFLSDFDSLCKPFVCSSSVFHLFWVVVIF